MYKKNPVMIVSNKELLPYTLGSQAHFFAQSHQISPSDFLGKSRVLIPDDLSWLEIDYRQKHLIDFSRTDKVSGIRNGKFQIDFLEEILGHFPDNHPVFRPADFLDWPFVFSAQLSFASQIAGVSPKELFRIFCIDYIGSKRNSWDEFSWYEELQPIWIEMELRVGGDYARLQ